jgi:hypothetical protein
MRQIFAQVGTAENESDVKAAIADGKRLFEFKALAAFMGGSSVLRGNWSAHGSFYQFVVHICIR